MDTTPNVFTFVDQTNVALNTVTTSAPITVAGINAAAAISVTTGEYSINGGAWTNVAGTVNNNDTVRVRHTSSGSNSTAVNTTLTIGGVSDVFTTTTLASGNSAPTANNFTYGVNIGNTSKTFDWKVLSAATDVDGDTLTATVQVQATKGTCAIAGDNETYTPAAGQTGSDTCTLRISDGQGGTKDIVVTLNNIDTFPPTTPTGGPTLAAVGGVYYSKLATSNIQINSVTGGRLWLNGADSGIDIGAGGLYNYDANVVEGNNNFSYTLKDALGNESVPLAFSVFRDMVAPGPLTWSTPQPTLKQTLYPSTVSITEAGSGVSPAGLSVTGDSGGVIANIVLAGNNVSFDYTTPNALGETLTITGTDKAGNG